LIGDVGPNLDIAAIHETIWARLQEVDKLIVGTRDVRFVRHGRNMGVAATSDYIVFFAGRRKVWPIRYESTGHLSTVTSLCGFLRRPSINGKETSRT
jgi:hypothetical protein